VRLLFAKEVATYIRERVWHPSQRLRERRDGRLEMSLATSGRKELTRWILSWMPHVQVLAPRQLRDRARQRIRQGLARCGCPRCPLMDQHPTGATFDTASWAKTSGMAACQSKALGCMDGTLMMLEHPTSKAGKGLASERCSQAELDKLA
jgi:hypothetical protein